MGTFFKEQLHLKEPFQTFKSLTPLQHTTRTDRMKFLLPILLISLAALCNIQPATAQAEAEVEALEVQAPAAANTAEEEAQVEAGYEGDETNDEQLSVDEQQLMDETIEELIELTESDGNESGMTRGATVMLRSTRRERVKIAKAAKFFRMADTNRSGKLYWGEFWGALYRLMKHKGYKASQINRHKPHVKKMFYKLAGRDRLISWGEVRRSIKRAESVRARSIFDSIKGLL